MGRWGIGSYRPCSLSVGLVDRNGKQQGLLPAGYGALLIAALEAWDTSAESRCLEPALSVKIRLPIQRSENF